MKSEIGDVHVWGEPDASLQCAVEDFKLHEKYAKKILWDKVETWEIQD